MRLLHSTSLLKNIGFVIASHLSINSKTRLLGRITLAPSPVTTHLGLVVIEERCPVVVAQ